MVRVPEIVLADEPTGSLDPDNKQAMLQWILETVRREDATLVLATHDHALLPQFDRVLEMASLAGSAEP
jgi:ABC-type lipoprotein export system ATPase subunit